MGSGRGEIVRRTHDAHAAPWVEYEQLIVTADDRLGSGREREFEILIVLWITASGDPHGRLKPDGGMAQYFQAPLTPCKRDCAHKPDAQSLRKVHTDSALIVFPAQGRDPCQPWAPAFAGVTMLLVPAWTRRRSTDHVNEV